MSATPTRLSGWRIGHRSSSRALPTLLAPRQTHWLGTLLLAVQLPQAPHLPIWVALLGIMLVVLRILLLRTDRARPQAAPARIPSWALVVFAVAAAWTIRQSFGYFVGRDPSVAFLYILVAIKFLEARSTRDGTLLICLACFLLITPFFYSQSLVALLAALPGVLLIGVCLDVLSGNGRAVTFAWRAAVRRSAVMMLQGLPVAALLFVLFPRLAGPLWGLPSDYGAQTGLSDSMSPGQISELSLSDNVAFRVDFEGPTPAPVQRYWRGPVFSRFDGRTWKIGGPTLRGELVPYSGPPVSYSVTMEPNYRLSLFALDLPASLPRIAGEAMEGMRPIITRDQQLLLRAPVAQSIRYTQTSMLRSSYPANVASETEPNLGVGTGNPLTLAHARELRTQHPGDADYVSAVLTWFNREQFAYTLSPPFLGRDPVDMFLFDTRRGFCEHYASAFVLLLRAAGIPARVVTGYQGGTVNPRGDYLIVRQSDAHAWAEAIIDGQWQRFDPTAAVAPSRIEMGLGGALPAGEPVPFFARLDGGWIRGFQLSWDAFNHDWRRNVIGFNYDRQRSLWRNLQLDHFAPWQIVVLLAGVVFAWGAVVVGWLMWKRRRQERALALWYDLCRRLARAGFPREPHEGPVAFSQRAAARWPQFAIAFHAIGESFAMLRYGDIPAEQERAALVATLERAIEVLPAPSTLRTTAVANT
jgi:transglutaminase-like putative cysteine protease